MGPRSIDRGNPRSPAGSSASREASMGPRSIDRGNAPLPAYDPEHPELQWGRDQLIAEMCVCYVRIAGNGWLQWGRDQLIAEIGALAGVDTRNRRASMGPRSIDRGNAATAPASPPPRARFNGAAIN